MRRTKVITTILISTLAISMFQGCAKKVDKNTGVGADGKVTISMLYSDNASYPYKEDWKVWDIIEEKTGVTFDIQAVPESDYESKKQIVFNSGDIPDIVTKTFAEPEDAMSGLLLPISDYEDKMPNFKKFIEDNNLREELDNKKMADGKYYTLPVKAHTSRIQDQQWLIRTDVLEENNLPIPTTLEELHEVGMKLKEIYPDSTPITNRFGTGNIMAGISSAFGTNAGWSIESGMYYDDSTDKWVFSPTSDNWKEMLMYTNQLIEDGVLDQEFGTLDSTVYEQKVVQGSTFIMYDWTPNISRYNLEGKQNDDNFNIEPIYPIKGQDDNYAVAWKSQFGQGWVLPASLEGTEKLDEILKFIDWCYTDEAETLLTFGVEGESYVVNEDGILNYLEDNVDYCATMGLDNNSITIREHQDFLYRALNKEQVDLFKKIAEDGCVPAPNPSSPLTVEQIEETKIYTSTLLDYANSMMENFIFGKESFDNWDKFVKECESKGSTKLEKEYNDAWKNRK